MELGAAGLAVRVGGVGGLGRVGLEGGSGERRALIGPNGAGKAALLSVIAGELRPAAGSVRLGKRDATSLPPWRRARLGLGRAFQRSTLFGQLTVAENVALAVRARVHSSWRFWPAGERSVGEEVKRRLETAGLPHLAGRRVATPGHGEPRILQLELALTGAPSAFLLAQPTAPLSPLDRHP